MLDATRSEGYDLSVIVPIHNAEKHIEGLAKEIFSLNKRGVSVQLICVDDASQDSSLAILQDLEVEHSNMSVILAPINGGAGLARNIGWAHASGRYTIFFDADDIMHSDVLAKAVRDMDSLHEADVMLFSYRYEREESKSFTEMSYDDRRMMDFYLNGSSIVVDRLENMAKLLTFTNYPWNKLLRTCRYQEEGLRFGSTKVNNDILGHWHSLLLARKIALRDEVVCTHIVHPTGSNLTNAFGVERLSMFDALEETYGFLQSRPDQRRRFAHHFWALCDRLTKWARPRIDPRLLMDFEARYSKLLGCLDLEDLARIRTKHSPALADSLVNHLVR